MLRTVLFSAWPSQLHITFLYLVSFRTLVAFGIARHLSDRCDVMLRTKRLSAWRNRLHINFLYLVALRTLVALSLLCARIASFGRNHWAVEVGRTHWAEEAGPNEARRGHREH